MSLEQQAGEMIVRLSELRSEYTSHWNHCQSVLREYVISQYPLDDRFEVWAEWCDKENHDFISEAGIPFLRKMVTDEPVCYERYQDYDWLFFLECFNDETNSEAVEMREKYGVTVDDVKELLIKHNFGSFTMDW